MFLSVLELVFSKFGRFFGLYSGIVPSNQRRSQEYFLMSQSMKKKIIYIYIYKYIDHSKIN